VEARLDMSPSGYEELRETYRPAKVRVLFSGESPPDPEDATRRFFYSPTLSSADNLFRGLMKALYDAGPDDLTGAKPEWLSRFTADGFRLQDLIDTPLNKLSDANRTRQRKAAAPDAAARIRAINPKRGVVAATHRHSKC